MIFSIKNDSKALEHIRSGALLFLVYVGQRSGLAMESEAGRMSSRYFAPRLKDVPGDQELYGFPHCAAAYPEHLRQFEFVGQFVACLQGQLCDVLVQLLFYLLGQQGVLDARKR